MTTVLVASGGGHLQQMLSLLPRMRLGGRIVWATPDSALSRDALRDCEHIEIPYIPARDWRGALKLLRTSRGILRDVGASRIISTGAAPAPPFFLAGAAMGLDLHFIETATRSTGPSLSGQLVARIPSAHLYTQYPHLVNDRWQFRGSIFDPFDVIERSSPTPAPKKIVVSLGTEKFDFRRAVEALIPLIPEGAQTLWQTGATSVAGLPIDASPSVPGDQMRSAIAEADLVVCHAGTGAALTAFEVGQRPLLLPREARFGEHVDDHQMLTAQELARRGLALSVRVSDLTTDHLLEASSCRVVQDDVFRAFDLVGVPARVPVPEVIDLRLDDSHYTAQLAD